MEVGEPDFDTPEHIKAAGIRAIQENFTHYTPSAGIPELRDAIAEYASRFPRPEPCYYTRQNVVVGAGAKRSSGTCSPRSSIPATTWCMPIRRIPRMHRQRRIWALVRAGASARGA